MTRFLFAFVNLVVYTVVSAQPALQGRTFIPNERSSDVSVIDLATRTVISTIPVGKRPRGLQISPERKMLYVALSGSPITPPGQERNAPAADKSADGIGVIDLATLKFVGKLSSRSDPEQFSLSLDGTRVYFTGESAPLGSGGNQKCAIGAHRQRPFQ